MKKHILLMILAVVIVSAAFGQDRRYEFESAILKKNTVTRIGLTEQTFSTVSYIVDYGRKEVGEIVMNIGGQTVTMLAIMKDGYIYGANMALKQGTKTNIATMSDFKTINFLNLTDEVKETYQIEEKGNEQVLGKDCKRYNMAFTTQGQSVKGSVWVWQGLMLKTFMATDEIIIVDEVTEIQEGVEIAEEKFELPEDIDFVEGIPQLFP
ncbi:MAG: hypothetical protein FWH23_00100 [Bacteroidales bacterium]|nr:hypothetical protein [Bacteroidales bacterium]